MNSLLNNSSFKIGILDISILTPFIFANSLKISNGIKSVAELESKKTNVVEFSLKIIH
jgi:hypothetical protein